MIDAFDTDGSRVIDFHAFCRMQIGKKYLFNEGQELQKTSYQIRNTIYTQTSMVPSFEQEKFIHLFRHNTDCSFHHMYNTSINWSRFKFSHVSRHLDAVHQ